MVKEFERLMVDTIGEQPKAGQEQAGPIPLSEINQKKVPARFKVKTQGEAAYQVTDPHSGLPVKNDAARFDLVNQLGITMRRKGDEEATGWACVYCDIDQLKLVNDRFGRDVGDAYIKWGATVPLEKLDEAIQLSDQAYAIPIRSGDRADEIVIWYFGVTSDEIGELRIFVEEHGVPDQEVLMPDKQAHTFSSSMGFVSSENPRLKDKIEKTSQWVKEDISNKPFELHTDVENLAANFASEEKIAKDLDRIPIEQLFEPNHIDKFIQLITSDFGGGRVSAHILELLLKLQSIKAASTIAPEKYQLLLEKVGVNKEEIEDNIRNATSAKEKTEIMVHVFQDLFGNVEET